MMLPELDARPVGYDNDLPGRVIPFNSTKQKEILDHSNISAL